MNLMYLSLINIEKKTNFGVRKKIEGQVKALKKNTNNCYWIYLKNSGLYVSAKNKEIFLKKPLFVKFEFIQKRIIYFNTILKFIKENNIEVIYIRYLLSDMFFISFIKECKSLGLKIYLEVATYPYDKEIEGITLYIDKFFREYLNNYVDRIITYSNYKNIFGIETININNGIDIDYIKISKYNNKQNEINLLGVASLSFWHGYDRVIEGLKEYYNKSTKNNYIVTFTIVGEGPALVMLKSLVEKHNLHDYVLFKGFKTGEELDDEFDNADIGIVSLGIHRLGLEYVSTLKSQEYWARGLPFIKSYKDAQIDGLISQYVLNIEPDDNSVNIDNIIDFYKKLQNQEGNFKVEMRNLAQKKVTWDFQMKPIIEEFEKNKIKQINF